MESIIRKVFLETLIHIYYSFSFIKTFSLFLNLTHVGYWAQVSLFYFPGLQMKTECLSCKHKALCKSPSQTVLIIQDNEQKPNSLPHAQVSVRWFIGRTKPLQKSEYGVRIDFRRKPEMSLLEGWVLTCGCYVGSKWSLWSEYLFRHVFPSWHLCETSVGIINHQTSEVIIRGSYNTCNSGWLTQH